MHGGVERSSRGSLAERVRACLRQFDTISLGRRLAASDATIWSDDAEVAGRIARRLGWIKSPRVGPVREVPAAKGSVMLLGMGGSSLGAEACACAFGAAERLCIVDSTIPAAVLDVEAWLPDVTDVVVASKSGDTVETVRAIEGTFGSTPFAGPEKVERAGELMAVAIDDSTLASLIGG